MRNCIDEGTLQAWFDGELAAGEAANITAHVKNCARCGQAMHAIEAENSMLSTALSAEFAEAIPSERLRQRVDAAVAGLQVTNARPAKRSWLSAVRDFVPSFRVLAYASATAAILLTALLALVYLKRTEPPAVASNVRLPRIAMVTPQSLPEPVVNKGGEKPANPQPQREARTLRRDRTGEGQATSLSWQERQYENAIAKLNEAIQIQAPLRPSLKVEYEYNLALINNAIATTREVARKNPNDPQASQFMLAAYQSKIDLMNQIADPRTLER
jgi:putative zinc finger protein